MDRIAKALEIASRNQEGFDVRKKSNHRFEPFTYTNTKSVPVDEQILERNRVLNSHSDTIVVDAYRLLRTRVLQRMRENGWRTLGITSTMPKEGKTLTAVNLGISIARELTQTALLVDADFRSPSVHELFALKPRAGIGDHLLSGTAIETILVNPGVDRFVLLPGRPGSNVSSEHLSSPGMAALIDELKRRYPDRTVIFDLPPVLIGDDVVSLAPLLDAILVVTADAETAKGQCQKAFELLEGTAVVGTVLNKTDDAAQRYQDYY